MDQTAALEDTDASALALQHLFVLCCYGGAPFIDYFSNAAAALAGVDAVMAAAPRMIDPTDWMASDMSGALLNASLHPQFMARHPRLAALVPHVDSGVELDACDLYNLTFSSAADESLFRRFNGRFACRCPPGRFGQSCEYTDPNLARRHSARITTTKLATQTTTETTTRSAEPTTKQTAATRNRTTSTVELSRQLDKRNPTSARRVTRRLPAATPSANANLATATVNTTTVGATTTVDARRRPKLTDQQSPTTMPARSNWTSAAGAATLAALANCSLAGCAAAAAALPLTAGAMATGAENPASRWTFSTYLVVFLGIMILMIAGFRLMRGCFCDCFGGFKNPLAVSQRYDAPIDANALNRCIDAVNAYERAEKNKYLTETRRPLISSVSETCPPYNPTVISAQEARGMLPHAGSLVGAPPEARVARPSAPPLDDESRRPAGGRAYSPPPSYHSSNGSLNARC